MEWPAWTWRQITSTVVCCLEDGCNIRCCTGKYDSGVLGVLFPFFRVALRGEAWGERLQIPNTICQIPCYQATYGAEQLVGRVMEVNRRAGEHPHPDDDDQIQSHVQQVEDHPGESGELGGPQGGHGRRFLHDEESGVGQDEGVSRYVVAVPEEAGPPAAGFGHELLVDDIQRVGFVTRTRGVLDVEEGLGEGVPHGCCHGERQQPAAEEGDAPAEGGVGEEEEGSQQEQRPSPRHFDKIPARGKGHISSIAVIEANSY